ncbi:MAG: hypothetical protein EKK64_01730 [Neisseriaceae bacterium]|nr:MAG: hypothetical protein EKK64_01730 [Neisseriaceae bacterium]
MNIEQVEIGKFYNFRICHKRSGIVLAIGDGNCIVKSPFVDHNQLIDLKNIISGIPEIGRNVEFKEIGKVIYTEKAACKSNQTVFFEYKKTNSYGIEECDFVEIQAEDILKEYVPSNIVPVFTLICIALTCIYLLFK